MAVVAQPFDLLPPPGPVAVGVGDEVLHHHPPAGP